MLKALIVDDEYIERTGIQTLIRSLCLPLETEIAEDGAAAYAYLCAHQDVDILITDIKMPFMDGLELAEKALQLLPKLQIIIYSAYEEFSLAKRALHLDVADYLVKPINQREFLSVLTRVIDTCIACQEKENRDQEIMSGYLKSLSYERVHLLRCAAEDTMKPDKLESMLAEVNMAWTGERRMILVYTKKRCFDAQPVLLETASPTTGACNMETINLNERECLIYLHDFLREPDTDSLNDICAKWIHAVENHGGSKCIVIVGRRLTSSAQYSACYKQLCDMLDYQLFNENSAVIFCDDNELSPAGPAPVCMQLVAEIVSALESDDPPYAQQMTENLFDMVGRFPAISAMYFKYICTDILRAIHKKLPVQQISEITEILGEFMGLSDLDAIRRIIMSQLGKVSSFSENSSRKIAQNTIRIIKEIIAAEYTKDISLEYIAEKVSRTPCYISNLFKNETGQNLIKYLTAYRMQKAADLLRQTNKKVVDISHAVGYMNPPYFGQLFKSTYGMSPGAYREENSK